MLKLDNLTVVIYIDKTSEMIYDAWNKLATEILTWDIMKGIFLSAPHVPGGRNTTADPGSSSLW